MIGTLSMPQGRRRGQVRSDTDSTRRTRSARRDTPSLRWMRLRCVRIELSARPEAAAMSGTVLPSASPTATRLSAGVAFPAGDEADAGHDRAVGRAFQDRGPARRGDEHD